MRSQDERSDDRKDDDRKEIKKLRRDPDDSLLSGDDDYKTFKRELGTCSRMKNMSSQDEKSDDGRYDFRKEIEKWQRDLDGDFLNSDDDETLLWKLSVWRRDLDGGLSSSDDDDEAFEQKLNGSNEVIDINTHGERSSDYMDDVRKDIEKCAKDSGYWREDSNGGFSDSDYHYEIFRSKRGVSNTPIKALSSHGERSGEDIDDVRKEIEQWAKDSGYWQEDSVGGFSSSDDDYETIRPNLSVCSTITHAVISQDEISDDCKDDDRKKTEELTNDSDGGFWRGDGDDDETLEQKVSASNKISDVVISRDEINDDCKYDNRKKTEELTNDPDKCPTDSDGSFSRDDDETFVQKVGASNKIADVMLSRNLKILNNFLSRKNILDEYAVNDLRNKKKLQRRRNLYLSDSSSSSDDDETRFLHEKLSELEQELESLRKKKKVKNSRSQKRYNCNNYNQESNEKQQIHRVGSSSSNFDEGTSSRVQLAEFERKLDAMKKEDSQNEKQKEECNDNDQEKKVNWRIGWLSGSSNNLDLSRAQPTESEPRLDAYIEILKKMENARNEKKDDCKHYDQKEKVNWQIGWLGGSSSNREKVTISREPELVLPYPIKEEDSQNDNKDDYYEYYDREEKVNSQTAWLPGSSSNLDEGRYSRAQSAEIELELDTIEEDSQNERKYDSDVSYDYDQERKENWQTGWDGSSSSSLDEQRFSRTQSAKFDRKLDKAGRDWINEVLRTPSPYTNLAFLESPRYKPIKITRRRSHRDRRSSSRSKCRSSSKRCYYCQKPGHIARVCKFRIRNIWPVDIGSPMFKQLKQQYYNSKF